MPNAGRMACVDPRRLSGRSQVVGHGGRHEGEQFLSRQAFELLTTTGSPTPSDRGQPVVPRDDAGWGLGMATPLRAPTGGFGWDGGWAYVAARSIDRVTAILFSQRAVASPEPPPLYVDLYA